MDYKTILEQLRAEHARVCSAIADFENNENRAVPARGNKLLTRELHSTHMCRTKSAMERPAYAEQLEPAIGCQRLLRLLQRYTNLAMQAARSATSEGRLAAEDAWRAAEKHRLEHRC
jgi:hypothetical protein